MNSFFQFEGFTPWAFLVDLGLLSVLLLIGKLIRVKVKIVQQLFIPPSLIAGLLGLGLGPYGAGWLPFSGNLSSYAAVLIALVFATLPFSSQKTTVKEVVTRVGPMWVYAQLGMLLQWGIMGLLGIYLFKTIWPDLNSAFGAMLPTGFYGGHGTAAAIGSAFENLESGLKWDDAMTLGMTTATAGVIMAIIVGLFIIKWGARHKHTKFIADFKDLPPELRTGLLPEGKRESLGQATTSSISIEHLTFHFALVFMVAFAGYALSVAVKNWCSDLPAPYSGLELPVFSCAFVCLFTWSLMFLLPVSISTYCSGLLCVTCADAGVAAVSESMAMIMAVPFLETVGDFIDALHSFVIFHSLSYLADDVLILADTDDVQPSHVPVAGEDGDCLQPQQLLQQRPVLLVVYHTVQLHIVCGVLKHTMQKYQLFFRHHISYPQQV